MNEAISEEKTSSAAEERAAELLPALQRLDRLLERAIEAAKTAYGPEAATDPYRGLYIGQAEMERLMARAPGEPALSVEEGAMDDPPAEAGEDSSRLSWLRQAYRPSSFELDVLLIALAPEVDLRYERLYAYLQDDVTRRRPSVDRALNLLCPSAEDKVGRRALARENRARPEREDRKDRHLRLPPNGGLVRPFLVAVPGRVRTRAWAAERYTQPGIVRVRGGGSSRRRIQTDQEQQRPPEETKPARRRRPRNGRKR